MTCREKLELEHPEKVNALFTGGCKGCPADYGYNEAASNNRFCQGMDSCDECWDQEVIETKNEENKGEKKMIEFATAAKDNRKTKEELLNDMADLKKEIELADKRKKNDDAARDLRLMYDSFIGAGFTPDQAFGLLTTIVANGLKK